MYMCKAKSYAEQLLEIYNNIDLDVDRLTKEVKIANLFNLDMLHEIEFTNFNACEGYKLAKQIRENQLFRRQSKYELETLIILKKFIDLNIGSLNKTRKNIIDKDTSYRYNIENKIYNPRVADKEVPKPKVINREFIDPVAVNSERRKALTTQTSETHSTTIPTLAKAIHKKSNEEIKILSKIDNTHYLVKRKNGRNEVLRSKHILNLELAQSAK